MNAITKITPAVTNIDLDKRTIALVHNDIVHINEKAFNALKSDQKADITKTIFGKKPKDVIYRPDFTFLQDFPVIAEKLAKGEDVALELAYNNILLPDDFQATLQAYHDAVSPVIAVVSAMKPSYPFADVPKGWTPDDLKFGELSIIRKGYKCRVTTAKRLWEKVSPWWAGKATKPRGGSSSFDGYGRSYTFYENSISIGCQTIQRYEVEHMAKHYGWEFP